MVRNVSHWRARTEASGHGDWPQSVSETPPSHGDTRGDRRNDQPRTRVPTALRRAPGSVQQLPSSTAITIGMIAAASRKPDRGARATPSKRGLKVLRPSLRSAETTGLGLYRPQPLPAARAQ